MIYRIADKEDGCYTQGCTHVVRYSTAKGDSCASHLSTEEFRALAFDLEEAIVFSALESDLFEVDATGDIRLADE